MRYLAIILAVMVLSVGCSTFKELKPDPKIESKEGGYIPIKDDDENFKLDKDGKYFIKFLRPVENNFYLILSSKDKAFFNTYFTDFFDDGEGDMKKANDENEGIDSLWVYRIGKEKEFYYWVIDGVKKETPLALNYRYTPIWRFKFEVKYEGYKKILEENTTDRKIYNSINSNYNFNNFNFSREISLLDKRKSNIEQMSAELSELENIFPDELAGSKDIAYLNYKELKDKVREELVFNKNYRLVLISFNAIEDPNFEQFLQSTDEMNELLTGVNRFDRSIIEKAKLDIGKKMTKAVIYYGSLIRTKKDITSFNLNPNIKDVDKLYRLSSKTIPEEFSEMVNYFTAFDLQADKMGIYFEKEQEMKTAFKNNSTYPNNSFYPGMVKLAKEMTSIVPNDETGKIKRFSTENVTELMSKAITNAKRNSTRLEIGFQIAEMLVPRLNNFRQEDRFKDMIRLLSENRELDYLVNQYPDLDRNYVDQQKKIALSNMTKWGFGKAEKTIRDLYTDTEFVNLKAIESRKNSVVADVESELFESVKKFSKIAVDSFVERNKMTITNVRGLYEDSSFVPVYNLTFSSKGSGDLNNKKAEISDYLNNMKFFQLPESAIKNIYNDFLRNINNRGVEKVRAIVEHGKYYKGTDRSIKTIVEECDINVPKNINKPMDYREMYVLPVTSNKQGKNEYMFRVRLKLPSDAQFPVFDINIKLPEEVAKNSGQQQWYDKITINNKLIKNEGRVKITSPTSSNNYEAQISPVQMDKDGRNVLEVRFTTAGFKVYKVSVMAQKPIIKKN